MTKPTFLPPRHLQPLTRKWFASVIEAYELEPHHARLLALAGEAWDRCCAARSAVEKLGMTFTDRHGDPRARPEIQIEIASRTSFVRLLRELDLDVEVPTANSRPPGLRSNRRGA